MALELLGGEPSRPSSVDPKTIPLLCCICPDVPRFSDVSHLITHIASKGHLHQVAQTKLKSHTDSDSSVKLQRYDSWYRAYGIESFLVVRMNTKKAKAAAGGKQRRDSSAPASEVC